MPARIVSPPALVSVVLPVYNQADHIEAVVRAYAARLAELGRPHEMILVPNGCRDASEAVCRRLEGELPAVRAVPSDTAGWGQAVRTGLRAAGGDLLCYTNAARTSAEDLVAVLRDALAHPGAVVKADRRVREGWLRRAGSRLFNWECRLLLGVPFGDVNGTPKAFPRRFDKLLCLGRPDDLLDAEFGMVCRREGYPVREVPVFDARRHGGRSTTRLRSALRMYRGAYRLWQAERGKSR